MGFRIGVLVGETRPAGPRSQPGRAGIVTPAVARRRLVPVTSPATPPPVPRSWALVQWVVLLATLAFAATILWRPEPSMSLFWNVVLPLLPLSFLATPVLWRAVCPLATLNMLGNRPGGRRLPGQVSRWAGLPSMLTLALLVPMRHLAFNTHPLALAGLVVVSGVAAVALGIRYDARAGFCNLVCPVLPVERLYGQHPVSDLGNPRCASCSVCTPRGCPDLALDKALPQLMGPARKGPAWLLTATGGFACAFPGFIIAYFTVPEAWRGSALALYGWIGGGLLLSLGLGVATLGALRVRSTVALPVLGALSAGAYFWFAVRGTLTTLGVASPVALAAGRVTLLAVVAWWLVRALREPRGAMAPVPVRRR